MGATIDRQSVIAELVEIQGYLREQKEHRKANMIDFALGEFRRDDRQLQEAQGEVERLTNRFAEERRVRYTWQENSGKMWENWQEEISKREASEARLAAAMELLRKRCVSVQVLDGEEVVVCLVCGGYGYSETHSADCEYAAALARCREAGVMEEGEK